jgi:hypothetical protein
MAEQRPLGEDRSDLPDLGAAPPRYIKLTYGLSMSSYAFGMNSLVL